MRKYASWSMAQGMRQGIFVDPLSGMEKVMGKEGAAWIAGNDDCPMLLLPWNPKIALTWKYVHVHVGVGVWY
jgi:hypothetical protein